MDLCTSGFGRSLVASLEMTWPLYLTNLITRFVLMTQWFTAELVDYYNYEQNREGSFDVQGDIPPSVYNKLGPVTQIRFETEWALPTMSRGCDGNLQLPPDYEIGTHFTVKPLHLNVVPLVHCVPVVMVHVELFDRAQDEDFFGCTPRRNGYFDWNLSNVTHVEEIDGVRVAHYLSGSSEKRLQRPWNLQLYVSKTITRRVVKDFEAVDPLGDCRISMFLEYNGNADSKEQIARLFVSLEDGDKHQIAAVELDEHSDYHLRWYIVGMKYIKDITSNCVQNTITSRITF